MINPDAATTEAITVMQKIVKVSICRFTKFLPDDGNLTFDPFWVCMTPYQGDAADMIRCKKSEALFFDDNRET